MVSCPNSSPVCARELCRISPPRFLTDCRMRRLNQGSFVLLYFALFALSGLCLVFVVCLFLICLLSRIFHRMPRRIAMARQKAVELTTIWKDKNVTSALKIRVMNSMVWAVFQYGVEGWTLKKSDRNRIESFEMWCWRKMLGISWKEHRTNISILEEIGLERELMGKLARMKLQYFGHVTYNTIRYDRRD